MDYKYKYIKYKTKYINLKLEKDNKYNKDNKDNQYTKIFKEVNIFGYTHNKVLGGGCIF